MCSFLYTASEPEYVITNGNGSIDNVTNQNGESFIAGAVCDVEVRDTLLIIVHLHAHNYSSTLEHIRGKAITPSLLEG